MNADERGLKHQDLTESILGAFYEVYNELGHGFLENVYEGAMCMALRARGHAVVRQASLSVYFRGVSVGEYRADIIVDQSVIVEVKTAKALDPAHDAQTLNYLRATNIEVALVLNFGPKPDFHRLAFDNTRKRSLPSQAV